MELLRVERFYLMVSGMRIPSYSQVTSKILYYVFAFSCFLVGFGINLAILSAVLSSTWTEIVSDLSLSCVLLTELLALIKMVDCLQKRRDVDELMQHLNFEDNRPKNAEEETIRNDYVRFARNIILMLIVLGNSTILFINFSHVINYTLDSNNNERPVSDLLFVTAFSSIFDVNETNVWYFWTLQTLRSYLAGAWTTAYDVLYFGFLSELCSQIDILAHRMKSLSPDDDNNVLVNKIKRHVQHLDLIYNCAAELNDIFRVILALQFCLTSFTISFTILQFTLLGFETGKLLDICICLFYFASIVTEFFLYCYFSNQLTTKSEDIFDYIYQVDLQLLMRHRNYFSVMTQRSLTPIIMDGGPLINLTLESFLKVMKTSYTAFNMLSESQ